jgi:hypothetical protein
MTQQANQFDELMQHVDRIDRIVEFINDTSGRLHDPNSQEFLIAIKLILSIHKTELLRISHGDTLSPQWQAILEGWQPLVPALREELRRRFPSLRDYDPLTDPPFLLEEEVFDVLGRQENLWAAQAA